MDIKKILNIIASYAREYFKPAHLMQRVKEALSLPYAKTYLVAAVILTALFFVFTFPYDILIRRYLKNLEGGTVRSIYVSEIRAGLIGNIMFNTIYLTLPSGSEIHIRTADADLSFLKLLLQKDISCDLRLDRMNYRSGDSTILVENLSGNIRLDFSKFSELPEGGYINIIVNNVDLKLSDLTLPESMGGIPLSLPHAKIKAIKMDAAVNGQRLQIRSCRIFGSDLSGSITGSLALSKRFSASALDLKLKIDTSSGILSNYRELLGKSANDLGQVLLGIKGTIASPRLDISQGGDDIPTRQEQPIDSILPTN